LGITGGTLDKMESIPGFRIELTMEQAMQQVSEIGVVMMGQTERFCPADKKLYALRDVTATVPSIPLITASIMSKKLAESLQRLVLDVKYGSGAFMKTREQAIALADSMVAVGKQMGVEVVTQINAMDEPLGHAVGNALEVIESINTMRGDGPRDLVELIVSQAEIITHTSKNELLDLLQSGKCWGKFIELIIAQGGNPDDLLKLSLLQQAPIIQEVKAQRSGQVTQVDAGMIGQAALLLGAGRNRASDSVDHRVGFDQLIKSATSVSSGDLLGRVHAATAEQATNAMRQLLAAIQISV
jgi:pyrimidine-nucleoside phosphorylase